MQTAFLRWSCLPRTGDEYQINCSYTIHERDATCANSTTNEHELQVGVGNYLIHCVKTIRPNERRLNSVANRFSAPAMIKINEFEERPTSVLRLGEECLEPEPMQHLI